MPGGLMQCCAYGTCCSPEETQEALAAFLRPALTMTEAAKLILAEVELAPMGLSAAVKEAQAAAWGPDAMRDFAATVAKLYAPAFAEGERKSP